MHEKSLLFALAPLAPLLHAQDDHPLAWFVGAVGAFSMFPLLRRDGLAGAYWGCLLVHGCVTCISVRVSSFLVLVLRFVFLGWVGICVYVL